MLSEVSSVYNQGYIIIYIAFGKPGVYMVRNLAPLTIGCFPRVSGRIISYGTEVRD